MADRASGCRSRADPAEAGGSNDPFSFCHRLHPLAARQRMAAPFRYDPHPHGRRVRHIGVTDLKWRDTAATAGRHPGGRIFRHRHGAVHLGGSRCAALKRHHRVPAGLWGLLHSTLWPPLRGAWTVHPVHLHVRDHCGKWPIPLMALTTNSKEKKYVIDRIQPLNNSDSSTGPKKGRCKGHCPSPGADVACR